MSAIAGLVGNPAEETRGIACERSLDALGIYGSRKSVRNRTGAAFGVNLHELVPEDRFDVQPYANDRFLFVADVRFDNRDEIIAALGLQGAEAKRRSDADLLFRAWCRWQDDCVTRIVGDYAFAVHDAHCRTLHLVRDPIGQRPLFYAERGGAVFFASMPSGILPHVPFDHDRVRIAQRLAARENESSRSYFAGISRVLSGEIVTISEKGVTKTRWSPRPRDLAGTPTDSLAAELRESLDRAVAARMRRTEGPLATHLSSGYDSTAVTATAAMLGDPHDVHAFTSAPVVGLATAQMWKRNSDESAIAGRTARQLGIGHEIVRTPEPLLHSLRNHTRYFQEPVRNVLNMSWYSEIERRASARGARVLLTGDLGNLSLTAGGLGELAEWIHRGAWTTWLGEARAASRREDVRWRGILMSSFGLSMPDWLKAYLTKAFVGQPPWISACFLRPEVLHRLPERASPKPRRRALERLDIMRGFDPGVFRKGSLAKFGIDERDPTADQRLVEFTLNLPPDQLLHNGVYKPLVRTALADRIPQFVLDLPMRGYQGADWVSRLGKADALATYEQIAENPTVEEIVDLPRLKRRICDWPALSTIGASETESLGRHVTNALAMGVFITESQNPDVMGR